MGKATGRNTHILRKFSQICLPVLITLLLAGSLNSCWRRYDDTLEKVQQSGRVVCITENSANTYYIYRGEPMGFEYDLARAFADYLGVELKIITPDWAKMFAYLAKGKGDFIAAGLTITPEREKQVDFSDEYTYVQQKVITHKNNYNLRSLDDLNGKTIHIRPATSYHSRLRELQEEGLNFEMVFHKELPTEELIRMVAEEEIGITIADSKIALLNRRYFPDIKIAFPIEEEEALGWAVREGEKRFLREINKFFAIIKENGVYGKIFEKYYGTVDIFDYVDLKKFHQRLESRLPDYQEIIKQEAAKYDFDWRLIAAMIYQESHFNPRARSHTGVRGLMQLTLRTAREMGVRNRLNPKQSIRGGIRYLHKLYERFDEVPDYRDRIRLALASYNIGYGHVRDAQKIAQQMGLPTQQWESVKQTLPLLRERRYYRDTRYGYARGTEPIRYVNRIFTYYDILKREAYE